MKINLVADWKKKKAEYCIHDYTEYYTFQGSLTAWLRKKETEINEQIENRINKIKKASFDRGYNLGRHHGEDGERCTK